MDFEKVYNNTSFHEGGFQKIKSDHGNWTGGKVGKGKLIGTKYGISAAQYPDEDIPNLSKARAKHLFKRDYWDKNKLDSIPAKYRLLYYDMVVNHGPFYSTKMLQRAINKNGGNLKIDGKLGPKTSKQLSSKKPEIDSIIIQRCKFIRNGVKAGKINKDWQNGLIDRALSFN